MHFCKLDGVSEFLSTFDQKNLSEMYQNLSKQYKAVLFSCCVVTLFLLVISYNDLHHLPGLAGIRFSSPLALCRPCQYVKQR